MKRITTMVKWIFAALAIAAFATVGLLRAQQQAAQEVPVRHVVSSDVLEPTKNPVPTERPVPIERPVQKGFSNAAKTKSAAAHSFLREPKAPLPGATPTPLAQVPVASPPPKTFEFKYGFGRQTVDLDYGPGNVASYAPSAPDDPELAALKQTDAAMAQETANRIARYAETEDEGERFALKGGLSDLLAKHFDVQQQLRERELAQVEARIKKLRDLAQKRRDAQQTIVQQRLEQLLREAEGLGWTPPENSLSAESVSTAPFARSGVGLAAPAYLPGSGGVGPGAVIAVPTSKN